jgi:hypothetical protein
MPRDGAIIGDPIGKLGVLRVECAKCGRAVQYRLARLMVLHAHPPQSPPQASAEILARGGQFSVLQATFSNASAARRTVPSSH